MSGTSIGALPAAGSLGPTDEFAVTQGYSGPGTGTTRKAALSLLESTLAAAILPATQPYVVVMGLPGTYTNGQVLAAFQPGLQVVFGSGINGFALCDVAATANVDGHLVQAGTTCAVVHFPSTSTTGTITFSGATTIAASSNVQFVGPASADTTWAGARLTMVATRAFP